MNNEDYIDNIFSNNRNLNDINSVLENLELPPNFKNELDSFVQVKYTNEQRIDILKMLYTEIHTIHQEDERKENRVSFSTATIYFAFSAYIFEKSPLATPIVSRIVFCCFIILIGILATSFLIRNSKRIRLASRLIVRVETALGFYSKSSFVVPSNVLAGEPFNKTDRYFTSLFPKDLNDWGTGDHYHYLRPHILTVILSGSIAILMLLIS